MKVLKFGGSSVANSERIKKIMQIVKETFSGGRRGVVVFSAFQGITDQLIEAGQLAAAGDTEYEKRYNAIHQQHIGIARDLLSIQRQSNILAELTYQLHQLEEILHGVCLVKELSARTLDYVMSFGERLAAYIISEGLRDAGFTNSYLDTRQLIRTDSQFGKARVDLKETNRRISDYFEQHKEPQIATGFIASAENEVTTTLGRGGSDFTASIFGAALGVPEIEIWSDVDGVLTADPGKVKSAFSIERLSYEEAMELSHFGAKVIYPPTMQPALDSNIPLRVRNSLNPKFPGTLVTRGPSNQKFDITGLSSIDKITLLTIQGSGMIGAVGIAERILKAMAQAHINIIMITQASSEHSICIAVLPKRTKQAISALNQELKYELREGIVDDIRVEENLSIIAVVGENMRHRKGLAGKVFQALGENDINIVAIAQGSSELNISIVISTEDESRALNAIHHAFFNTGIKVLNLFLLGTGVVGGALLGILARSAQNLLRERGLEIRLAGLANVDGMLTEPSGIDPASWQKSLKERGSACSIEDFVQQMIDNKQKNKVFVDCTASDQTMQFYADLLRNGAHVVTPNKKANTQSFTSYRELRAAERIGKSLFRYETNVGAGLPVIQAIRDLIAAGDEIVKIEGVLSGTLSYIFNNYSANLSFAAVVEDARKKGYTEPDPRDDLCGMDVARKILILAREAGWKKELNDVMVQNLSPEETVNATTVETYFKILKKYDDEMRQRAVEAEQTGAKLCYIASAAEDKLSAGLKTIKSDHPFYSLQGSDNIIAIWSKFYPIPLVIRGAGAGADVTAAGVFADILKTINSI